MGVRYSLLIIAVVALVGCGKKEPVQPSASNPEANHSPLSGGGVELIYDILECGRWAGVAFLLKRGLDFQRERHNQM